MSLRTGGTNLQHLNEGQAKIQVGHVAEDQAQAEAESDRDHGSKVYSARHLHSVTAVEESRRPGQDLGGDGGKAQMKGRESDGYGGSAGSASRCEGTVTHEMLLVGQCLDVMDGGEHGRTKDIEYPFVEDDDARAQ